MKKLILAALAASVAATPALAAPQRHAPQQHHSQYGQYGNGHYGQSRYNGYNRGWQQNQSRNWHRGERFDYRYARNYRSIGNPHAYRGLYNAPRGYHWVQSGNDAVLVGLTTGLIAAVIAGAIN